MASGPRCNPGDNPNPTIHREKVTFQWRDNPVSATANTPFPKKSTNTHNQNTPSRTPVILKYTNLLATLRVLVRRFQAHYLTNSLHSRDSVSEPTARHERKNKLTLALQVSANEEPEREFALCGSTCQELGSFGARVGSLRGRETV